MENQANFSRRLKNLVCGAVSILLCGICIDVAAQKKDALHAHAHGQAQLQLAIDQNQVVLSFSSPLDNFLGFERAPKNEKERIKVQQLLQQLQNPLLWFEFSPAAQCRVGQIDLDSPVLTGKQNQSGDTQHGDLRLELEWHCQHPQQLRNLRAILLQQYRGIHRLKTEVVHPGGQRAKVLRPGDINMRW